MIFGGAQERNMRGGTENVYGIVGLAKALEMAYADIEEPSQPHSGTKKLSGRQAQQQRFPEVYFNGEK